MNTTNSTETFINYTNDTTDSYFNMLGCNKGLYKHMLAYNALIAYYKNIIGKINFSLLSFGILSNTICIFVFSTKNLRKSKFNLYLLLLAIIELAFCITLWAEFFCEALCTQPISLSETNVALEALIHFCAYFFDSCAIMITLIMSIDRIYAIFNPMKSKDFITSKNMKLSVSIGFLICGLVRIVGIPLHLASNRAFLFTYNSIIASILLVIIPGISILILNIILFMKIINYDKIKKKSSLKKLNHCRVDSRQQQQQQLQQKNKKRKSSNDTSNNILHSVGVSNYQPMTRSQKSHYIVIIAIGLWLLITETPYNLIKWIMCVSGNYTKYFWAQFCSAVLYNSNHCINIFIYIFFHDAFRTCLKNISTGKWNLINNDGSFSLRSSMKVTNNSFKIARSSELQSSISSAQRVKILKYKPISMTDNRTSVKRVTYGQ